ncbi:restriction endonuclease subunit S [Xanthomonas hortorum]|uniref:Restriction endonuclease subunit S n=1 Tax=Xanthomonas hortorum pv. hederae TaxID=453603 RepID=A0A9X4HA16_9XANT|nr:restriction endonuclease subunit S [Xanthomonas hortorum]MCE4373563.1 restriction endonuclease subunit S [Xanthomonas hortorum pv. hederae]MDC8640513.1 restriction endonuclease subunit S [Xanthomonas hortorum pv. hederae]
MANHALISTLAKHADIRMGYPFRGSIHEVAGGSVRVVQIRDVPRTGLCTYDALVATEVEGRKHPDWLLDQDIVFIARGANTFAALAQAPPPRTLCSPHIYVIRVKAPRLLPAFLAWQLNQAPAQRYLRQSAEGSNQLSIRRTVLDMTPIRVPPLSLQQAVIALEQAAQAERAALHALIDNRTTELAILAERLLA